MEKSCYKCGQVVEDGRAFCPHCAAPQIRVVITEPVAVTSPLAETGLLPQGEGTLPASQTVPVLAVPVQWSQAARPCAIAAAIAAVAMVLKIMVPIVAALGAGFLAVALYRRSNPGVVIQARLGARLGAICGFFCFCMTTVLAALRITILHEGDEVRRPLLDSLQQQALRYSDPQYQASLEFMRSPAGLAVMIVFMLILLLLIFLMLGTLGGALGGASFGRRNS